MEAANILNIKGITPHDQKPANCQIAAAASNVKRGVTAEFVHRTVHLGIEVQLTQTYVAVLWGGLCKAIHLLR